MYANVPLQRLLAGLTHLRITLVRSGIVVTSDIQDISIGTREKFVLRIIASDSVLLRYALNFDESRLFIEYLIT